MNPFLRGRGAVAPLVVFLWLACAAGHARAEALRSRHVRIASQAGPIHVWAPAGYVPDTAGIVVYVHGYYSDVDGAWYQHHLAHQFADSKLNALFIACSAPRWPADRVAWPSLSELLDTVAEQLGDRMPAGRVIAVGHSAAHRTLTTWLEEGRLDTVVLVDALYGELEGLREWLEGGPGRRLIDVGSLTRPWADELHATLPDTLVIDGFPQGRGGELPGARDSLIVYVRTQVEHMRLVTGGVALPILLRSLWLPTVASARKTARR